MNNHLNMLPKQAKFDFKCIGGWGSTPDLAGGLRCSARPPSRKGLRRLQLHEALLQQSEPPWLKSCLRACSPACLLARSATCTLVGKYIACSSIHEDTDLQTKVADFSLYIIHGNFKWITQFITAASCTLLAPT